MDARDGAYRSEAQVREHQASDQETRDQYEVRNDDEHRHERQYPANEQGDERASDAPHETQLDDPHGGRTRGRTKHSETGLGQRLALP
jgi:hypothetical protein